VQVRVRSYFFHDPLDGVGAPAALGAAAEVAIDLAHPRPSSGFRNSSLKLMVTEHVARADDHYLVPTSTTLADFRERRIPKSLFL
jgi:hypothetical protein